MVELGTAVEHLRDEQKLKFATDFRPHSHHYQMMSQVRAADTESGTLNVGGAKMCAFMTSWGDGIFAVELGLDATGQPALIRIVLATEQAIANMAAVNDS